MADEFQIGSGNWWDTTSRNRFDGGATVPASVSTTLNTIAGFGLGHDQSSGGGDGGVGGGGLANPNMQMMGLGLSSQSMDWNQALLGEKGGNSFRSMLEEDMSSNSRNFQSPPAAAAQELWRQKLYSGGGSPDQDSSVDEFKQINRLFCSQASSNDSTITSNNLTTGFPASDSGAAYGLLLPENQHHHHSAYENRPMNYQYPPNGGYCGGAELLPTWNKFQPFSRSTSPPKQPPPSAAAALHFTNNTPFWNASPPPPAAMTDARSSFFTGLQTQIPASPCFDEKPKTTSESRDLSTATLKKSSTETSNKRPRNETPSPLPAFKVRKEKMGDRITALQQLVSPFGKTDTASVLSEAIEYIKFLHEQVSVLSTPYMKNGAPIQQINSDKLKDPAEGGRQDLRSRGLCLVPVSSTFPVTHETTVDFWTPTFGGSFR